MLECTALTVNDFGNARVGAKISAFGGAGAAATTVARADCLPTGVFGRSSAAGTDTGALDDFIAGVGEGGTFEGTVLAAALTAGAFPTGNFGGAIFVLGITFSVAFRDCVDGTFAGIFLGDLAVGLAFLPALFTFATGLRTLAAGFVTFAAGFARVGAGFAFARALAMIFGAGFDLLAGFDFAVFDLAAAGLAFFGAGLAFAAALPLAGTLGATFFFTTFAVFVTFVDFPLALPLVAVLVFFAVANLISSAVRSCAGSCFARWPHGRRPFFENA